MHALRETTTRSVVQMVIAAKDNSKVAAIIGIVATGAVPKGTVRAILVLTV
jgi:hypothetical protein